MRRWFGGGGERRSLVVPLRHGDARRRGGFALPFLVLAVATVAIGLYVRHLLTSATAGDAVGSAALPLYLAAGAFLVAAAAVVVLQSVRMAQRVAGPEYRLIQTLRRIRAGDVSFRVHLRRGDLLHGLAEECNALLDWLNRNPPVGARTGTDVFEIGALEGYGDDLDRPLEPALDLEVQASSHVMADPADDAVADPVEDPVDDSVVELRP